MQNWLETTGLLALNEVSVTVRILLAVVFGGVLGFERTSKGRPAGLRTYMLVSLAGCLVMLSGLYLFDHIGAGFDPSRMAAQVLSGIGFLGAGTIMLKRYRHVTGLTTAAGLFTTACIGITTGLGFYFAALMTLLACILIMVFADRVQSMYISARKRMHVHLVISELGQLKPILAVLQEQAIAIRDLETFSADDSGGLHVSCTILFPAAHNHTKALEELLQIPSVLFAEELDS